ncbi:MAG: peptide deformylase [Chloroflexi bacterium]|nr:peptide deformylase [Chloroflexota bacterium]
MTVRQIVYSDDPLLRKKSRRVKRINPDMQQLIDDMVETMYEANGIGLAAIQVGVPERIVVVQLPLERDPEQDPEEAPTSERGELYVVINPKLTRRSREVEDGIEGCLSVLGWVGEVERHTSVMVKGLDRDGENVRIKAEGMLARVFQHEIDHCEGIIFTDLIEDPEKIWPVPEGEEEAAEAAQQVPDSVVVSESIGS